MMRKTKKRMKKRKHEYFVFLDMMMPIMDGRSACEKMRKIPELEQTIILFLSAIQEEECQLSSFRAGADDYINKPIKMNILRSRVQAILKRIEPVEQEEVAETLEIDVEHYQVRKGDNIITLPRKEFSLLQLLHSEPGKLFTREEIYAKVWGSNVIVGDRTIDVHIRKLRQKIGEDHIVTIKGVGYKFEK